MVRTVRKHLWRGLRSFTAPADDAYSATQKLLHWAIAILCLAQVPTAWAIQRTYTGRAFLRPSEADLFLRAVHAWAGWTILALVALRLVLRIQRNGPGLPAASKPIYRYGAAVSHASLYIVLVALPVTGTLTMYVRSAFGAVHSVLAWVLLGLVGLHVAAAMWHQFVLRDGRLLRIVPGLGSVSETKAGDPDLRDLA